MPPFLFGTAMAAPAKRNSYQTAPHLLETLRPPPRCPLTLTVSELSARRALPRITGSQGGPTLPDKWCSILGSREN